jgi:hypothetical protein
VDRTELLPSLPTELCMHLSSLPYMSHASPVSPSLVRSPEWHFQLGTRHEAPAYYAAGTLQLLAVSQLPSACMCYKPILTFRTHSNRYFHPQLCLPTILVFWDNVRKIEKESNLYFSQNASRDRNFVCCLVWVWLLVSRVQFSTRPRARVYL